MKLTEHWLFWSLLSAATAACTAVLSKASLAGVQPDLASLARAALIVPLLAAFVAVTGGWRDAAVVPTRTWLLLGASALSTAASWLCYFRALKVGDASKVAPVDKLSLVLVVVFAVAFLGERPAPREWLGIGMVAAGVVVLAFK